MPGILLSLGIATVAGAGSVVAAPLILGAVGFTAAGVAAGSLAAATQATIGNVAAGSIFAALQSVGAAGLGYAGTAGVFSTAAGTVGAVLVAV